jgi:hypothetical protein
MDYGYRTLSISKGDVVHSNSEFQISSAYMEIQVNRMETIESEASTGHRRSQPERLIAHQFQLGMAMIV